jgi:putative permease
METQLSSPPNNWPFRRVVWATLVLVLVVLGFWLLYRFYMVVFSFFIAIILGMVIRPVVTWLHKRGLPRLAGVILIYILLLALVIGFLLLLFPLIFEQGATIAATVPGYYQSLREWMFTFPNQMMVTLVSFSRLPYKV